ncbi:MAG TPA: hypothetical protein VLJ21_03835 [Candidatus Binatia bacterium]|nr:hypothetical protein [Candidatus Binatia bacterium]
MATLHFTPQGILFKTATATLGFGDDSGDADIPMEGSDERFSVKDILVVRHAGGTTIALPDATVEYFPKTLKPKDAKAHPCNVLILGEHRDATKIIKAVNPRLAILHNGNLEHAREIQKSLGIQTIAANPGLVVNLKAYNALSSQQRLVSFTSPPE